MEPKRIFDFVSYQKKHYPLQKALCELNDNQIKCLSTQQIIEQSNQIARGLIRLGLQPKDKIAIVTYRNRIAFTLLDLGIQKAGMISIPLYPTISAREYEYILNDCEAKAIVFGSGDLKDKISKAQKNVPSLVHMFSIDPEEGFQHWETWWKGESTSALEDTIDPARLATIIYTSGTTGDPKGVMLSHRNVVENVKNIKDILPVVAGDRVLSFLPLCHIFERAASFSYLYIGLSVTYTGLDNLGGENGDLQRIQPHFMTCVPRLLEKIYEKIYQKGLDLSGLKKALFFWALQLTEDYAYDKTYKGLAKTKRMLADKLIFSKWRAALGGQLKGIITGAAPCPLRIAQVFSAAGIPVREGYGLTEASPGISISLFEKGGAKLGMVGPVLQNVEVQIDASDAQYSAGEGEVLASGPNIMIGYYNKPDQTSEMLFEKDGKIWLRTGDVGRIENYQGRPFLKITDRKKELLKTSGGKYVAPAPIENKLKEEILIEQVMVVGDQRNFVTAIIVPAMESLKKWCSHKGLEWDSFEHAVTLPEVIRKMNSIVDRVNPLFSKTEQIKKFKLVCDVWEPTKTDGSESELTPTLKLKRRVLQNKYQTLINDLYAPDVRADI